MTQTKREEPYYRVTFIGFLQDVVREFDTKEEANTWLRKVGKYGDTNTLVEQVIPLSFYERLRDL